MNWLQNLVEPLDYNLLPYALNELPYDLRAIIDQDSANNYEYDIMLVQISFGVIYEKCYFNLSFHMLQNCVLST